MNVIVIGAGIVGVAIADALARGGARPVVVDMRGTGLGASRASAGILAPYVEGYGHESIASLGARSLALFDDFIAALRQDTGHTIEYARTGTLEVAFGDGDLSALHAKQHWMGARGVASDWLDATAAGEFEPALSANVAGGLFTPAHGFVGAKALIGALTERAKFAGAVFESPVEAVAIHPGRTSVEVHAGDRRYEGDAVVIASGSWSGRVRVANLPALPVRPVRGQLLHLRWRTGVRPARIVWSTNCYTVPWSDDSLLVGATVEHAGFNEHSTTAGILSLSAAVTDLFPDAGAASVDDIRVGLRPVLPDELPAIGPYGRAPRVTVATGHYRNGVLLAPLTAEIVSKFVLKGEKDPAFDLTSPDRALAWPARSPR